jgi:predicted nucleic acid-binding Zn ribbon protein
MPAAADLRDRRFGRLVAKSVEAVPKKGRVWTCACDCGGTTRSNAKRLLGGITRSCGCLKRELLAGRVQSLNAKHRHEPRRCEVCRGLFTSDTRRQIYCSAACMKKACFSRPRSRKSCEGCGIVISEARARRRFCSAACRNKQYARRRKASPSRACALCGEVFAHGGTRAAFCSERCRGIARARRQAAREKAGANLQFANARLKLGE